MSGVGDSEGDNRFGEVDLARNFGFGASRIGSRDGNAEREQREVENRDLN